MSRDVNDKRDRLMSACWYLCQYWFFWYLFFYCLVYVATFFVVYFLFFYFPNVTELYLSSAIIQTMLLVFSVILDVFLWCFCFYLSFSMVFKKFQL